MDKKGVVYAGTSPDGKVYRIENGQATEYFAPKARYIWSLAVADDGTLYVGTGDQGKIFRVTSAGNGELWYETGQSHITGLAVDSQGRLLAGSEPNGILYRISAKDKAFVLYDANLPEIRAIVPMPDGTVYAAALGGSVAKRAQSAAQAAQGAGGTGAVPATTTTITVEAQAGPGGEIKPPESKPQTPASDADSPGQYAVHSGHGRRAVWKNLRSTASIRTTPSRRSGVPRKRTSTMCSHSNARSSSPPTRTAASTVFRRTAASLWWPRPARARPPASCPRTIPCSPPPATWAESSGSAKSRAPAAPMKLRRTIPGPPHDGAA